MYTRRSEDVQDIFWTSYVRSIYVLCLRGSCFTIYCTLANNKLLDLEYLQYSHLVVLYNKYRLLLVLCYLGGLPLLDSIISWLKYLFHHLILKGQDMFLKHISNCNGEQHYILQVIKLFCNCGLLRYLHSNGSMKSARMKLFSLVWERCRKNKQQKRFKKNE